MRTAPSAQFTELVESRVLTPVPLITLTAPGGMIFRWSDGPTLFDSEDYQPFLIETSTFRQVMDHLPSDTSFGELTRNFDFSLRNGEVDDIGTRLSELLRASNPLGGTIEFRQVIVDRRLEPVQERGFERETVRTTLLDRSTVFFRGTLEQLGPINNELIRMSCTGEQIVGGLETGRLTENNTFTEGTYDAIGAKHSVVYGKPRRVRCLPVRVGPVTTLAAPFTNAEAQNIVTLTRIDGFQSNGGQAYIGGELISYTGISGSTITGVGRDPEKTTNHFAGESVVDIPVSIIFSAAVEASVIRDVYVRNPANDALLRVTTPYEVVLVDDENDLSDRLPFRPNAQALEQSSIFQIQNSFTCIHAVRRSISVVSCQLFPVSYRINPSLERGQ